MKITLGLLFVFTPLIQCSTGTQKEKTAITTALPMVKIFDSAYKTIHVMVALCDNTYQSIVPVPASIGNGQKPNDNLYWGCAFGVKTFFKKSSQWKLIKQYKMNDTLMERIIFKNNSSNYYLVADAYNGKYIKDCTINFLHSCAGKIKDTVKADGKIIGVNGNASLLAYIGHDGLMDFSLHEKFDNIDGEKREAIILACISKKYFAPLLSQTKANPLLWSTGLMSPEAYTLHDAVEAYINKQDVGIAAAKAYSKYQKCSLKAAQNLLVTQ